MVSGPAAASPKTAHTVDHRLHQLHPHRLHPRLAPELIVETCSRSSTASRAAETLVRQRRRRLRPVPLRTRTHKPRRRQPPPRPPRPRYHHPRRHCQLVPPHQTSAPGTPHGIGSRLARSARCSNAAEHPSPPHSPSHTAASDPSPGTSSRSNPDPPAAAPPAAGHHPESRLAAPRNNCPDKLTTGSTAAPAPSHLLHPQPIDSSNSAHQMAGTRQLQTRNAQRINVTPRVHIQRTHLRLLRAHVRRRPNELLQLRVNRLLRQIPLRRLGDSKINHLRHRHAIVQCHQDVRRLDIPKSLVVIC